MIFGVPFAWLALREAYAASEHRWAVRWRIDDDGTARGYPLFVRDLPMWVDQVWDYPDPIRGSMEPTNG